MKKNFIIIVLLLVLLHGAYAVPAFYGNDGFDGSIKPEVIAEPYCTGTERPKLSASSAVPSAITGTRHVLVLLVEFSDSEFSGGRNVAYYENILETGSGLTMKKYYSDMSNGSLELKFEICGPYKAKEKYAYYGENGDNDDKYSATLVWEAVTAAINAKGSSFFTKFDNDNDGEIDTVMVIHAGLGEEEHRDKKNYIWSHSWKLSSAAATGDGRGSIQCGSKKFDSYTLQPEYSSAGKKAGAGIGVFCHEYGHTLGLRDLYDIDYTTQGVGHWSLMGSGNWGSGGTHGINGADPAPLLAYERAYLGWLKPEIIVPEETSRTYDFGTGVADKVYRIDLTEDGKQYLLLEGRKKNVSGSGMFVSEDGLLITHIHQGIIDKYNEYNRINNNYTRVHGINVLEAKSNYYSEDPYGRGNLWNSNAGNRITQTALFRSDTKTDVAPASSLISIAAAALTAAVIFRRRKKLCVMLMLAVLVSLFSLACAVSDGSNEEDWGIVGHPNTNYYMSDTVNSKVGFSGVCIENIKSGSFTVRLEK